MSDKKALIIDDEPDIRELLEITLARMDIDVADPTFWDGGLDLLEAMVSEAEALAPARGSSTPSENS